MVELPSGYHHTFCMVETLIHFVWGKHCGVSPHTFCMINSHYAYILSSGGGEVPLMFINTDLKNHPTVQYLSTTYPHGVGGSLFPRRTQTCAISKNQYLDVPENMT